MVVEMVYCNNIPVCVCLQTPLFFCLISDHSTDAKQYKTKEQYDVNDGFIHSQLGRGPVIISGGVTGPVYYTLEALPNEDMFNALHFSYC